MFVKGRKRFRKSDGKEVFSTIQTWIPVLHMHNAGKQLHYDAIKDFSIQFMYPDLDIFQVWCFFYTHIFF